MTGLRLVLSMIIVYLSYPSDATNNEIEKGALRRILKKGRRPRRNEDKCAARRCCNNRFDLDISTLPSNLNCKRLSDDECGENDEFCVWDCDLNKNGPRNKKFKRKFRGISLEEGEYKELDEIADDSKSKSESLHQCLSDSKLLSIDDCGVEYDEELDENEQEFFCRNHKKYRRTKKSDRRRLVVLGSDDRTQVSSTAEPYSAVLYILFDKSNGLTYRCTATMISPRWAITSAHCVYGAGDFYGNFRLYKNVFGCADRTTANEFTVNKRYILSEWASSSSSANDIAFLRLDIEPNLGYLDFGFDDSFSNGAQEDFNIISYPADKPDCSKWFQNCPYNEFTTYTMKTVECDTYGGASGPFM